jgi:hypothetical protein
MAMPQINQEQVNCLTSMATGVGAISVAVPDAKQDSYEQYNLLTTELCDLSQLVILGLLKEITNAYGDRMAELYAETKRNFRIFEITAMGSRMFDGVERKIQ